MKVNPINTTNQNIQFRADIKPSQSLKSGFEMMQKYADSASMKDLNSVKDFVDSLARISESKKIAGFKIEIDRNRENYVYTKINGRRVCGKPNEHNCNLQDSYLAVEGTKKYASHLEEIEPSVLDSLKAEVEKAEQTLSDLKERYSARLRAELEQAQKLIFRNAE